MNGDPRGADPHLSTIPRSRKALYPVWATPPAAQTADADAVRCTTSGPVLAALHYLQAFATVTVRFPPLQKLGRWEVSRHALRWRASIPSSSSSRLLHYPVTTDDHAARGWIAAAIAAITPGREGIWPSPTPVIRPARLPDRRLRNALS